MTRKPNNTNNLNKRKRHNLYSSNSCDITLSNDSKDLRVANKNYQIIEEYILQRLDKGMDLIDILILARETFSNTILDSYLYEMRAKGLI